MNGRKTGIIGGSGLYRMEGLEITEEIKLDTPFGPPSDRFFSGHIADEQVVFLPRHGSSHGLLPGEIPYRANIFGFKSLGVDRIISVSSVGSLKENIHPRDIVIPDQFIDRTRSRKDTFFGDGIVAHISFSDPVCPALSKLILTACRQCGTAVHEGGTYVCIEGPAFSTRAESNLYRSWDVEIIGMTNYQEARLAREAEICYATIACVTDYDCWHESEEAVNVQMLINNLKANTETAQKIIKTLLLLPGEESGCGCGEALEYAILTRREDMPASTLKKLETIIGA